MIKVGVAEQQLDGIERVPLREKPAGKRSPPRVAAISAPESSRSIEARHIALQAVGSQVIDLLAGFVRPAFDAQLVAAAFVRQDEARLGHKTHPFQGD